MRNLPFFSLLGALTAAVTLDGQNTWLAEIVYRNGIGILHTDSIRCLASSAYSFSHEYGVVVTYEDAPLLNKADVIDVTDPAYTASGHKDRFFIPRGGPLDARFPVKPGMKPVDNFSALQTIVDAYTASGYPGSYKLVEQDGRLEILPTMALDAQGKSISVDPVMDQQISLPIQARSGEQTLNDLLLAIRVKRGVSIVIGTVLPNDVRGGTVPPRMINMKARDIVSAIFSAAGKSASWLLLFDPTKQYYVLSFFGIS